ncbi:MAG: hypothetical protein M0D55_15030 [Elusimicrobiota bacterium]|nr:MAG: hypothetical protein M0D55_15030 [Elusimicrobiota bacterium]
MFIYMSGVGFMEKSELDSLLRGVKKGGRIQPPPYHECDLPQGHVKPLREDAEAMSLECLSEVLLELHLRRRASDGLQPCVEKAEKLVTTARELLREISAEKESV